MAILYRCGSIPVPHGRIAYAGGRGPFGFRPQELTAAIDVELAKRRDDGQVKPGDASRRLRKQK